MTISTPDRATHVWTSTMPAGSPAMQDAQREGVIREIVRDVRDGIRDGMRADQSAGAASNAEASAVEQAEAAAAAAEEAAAAQGQAARGAEPGGDPIVRITPDGLEIVQIQPDGSETVMPWDASNVIPPQVTDIMLVGVLGLIGIIMAFPIGRAVARWIDRRGAAGAVPKDVSRRLAAIEDSVQSVAIEMERMSEANRYTARLLTERTTAPDFRAGEAREPGAASPESSSPRSTWQAS